MSATSYYSEAELRGLGLARVGSNVRVSRKASIYVPELIEVGHDVRIDDFAILSGRIEIGSFVHVAAFAALYGSRGIALEDFVGISGRVTVYTESDDFMGEGLTGPTVPDAYRAVRAGAVRFGRHAVIGAGSVVLPGVTVGEGTTVGALSLVNASLPAWKVAIGIPARPRWDRRRDVILRHEAALREQGRI